MAINVDVVLVSTVRQDLDLTVDVELEGGLGSTNTGSDVDVDVDLLATASGAYIALQGSIDVDADLSGAGQRLLMVSVDNEWPFDDPISYRPFHWYMETTWTMEYYEEIVRSASFATEDVYGQEVIPMSLLVSNSLAVVPIATIDIPDPPAAPPGPEPGGDFPIPAYGGMIVRAVPGIAVQVDTPVIVNGRPT